MKFYFKFTVQKTLWKQKMKKSYASHILNLELIMYQNVTSKLWSICNRSGASGSTNKQKQSPEVFYKKHVFLQISQNSLENVCARELTKRLWQSCFPVNFAKFLRTPFLQNNSKQLLWSKSFFVILYQDSILPNQRQLYHQVSIGVFQIKWDVRMIPISNLKKNIFLCWAERTVTSLKVH